MIARKCHATNTLIFRPPSVVGDQKATALLIPMTLRMVPRLGSKTGLPDIKKMRPSPC